MSNWQPTDLTGDPEVEKQIREYARKKYGRPEIIFVEGIANRERKRAEFTIDNSYMQKVSNEDMELHNRVNSTAWKKYYKADKIRKRYEEEQIQSYAE